MRRSSSAVTSSISKLIDAVMDGYVGWREESVAVDAAYREWVRAASAWRALAFEDYCAALDREERAASEYQRLLAIAQSATA
ncbi:MAG TPA: hypothetical protein VMF57_16710 [Solirubrobacteraceae bacterium]|nr:hypothetical protein [Solirubrobacteraceae bacterium]